MTKKKQGLVYAWTKAQAGPLPEYFMVADRVALQPFVVIPANAGMTKKKRLLD